MNKRLAKKQIKKRESFFGVIDTIGNNGGDILTIFDNCDGTIHLRSGHCCVVDIDKTVPVEFITALLHKVMLEYEDVEAIIDTFCWDEKYKAELKAKIKGLNGCIKAVKL